MGTNSFSSVFSFDGKIYVKTAADSEKMHIKNKEACSAFISTLDGDSVGVLLLTSDCDFILLMEEVTVNISDRVQKQIDLCLNMKPEDNTHNEVDEIHKKT